MTRMSNKLGSQFWKSLLEIVELFNRGKFLCCKISLLLLIVEIQNGKRRKIPQLKSRNIKVMIKMEMLTNMVLHFYYRKMGSKFWL